jgi:FlaA1/EpsC-like NDP-sugar epimerase
MSNEPLHKETETRPSLGDVSDKSAKHPVFITGGTGYIGSRLIKKLLKKNYRVIASEERK